jgi:protein-S-isoprenylcysteine O-methyltransferase Ste14
MRKKLIVFNFMDSILSLAGMGVALFWSAGRLNWWQAWVALGVMAIWLAVTGYISIYIQPELLEERVHPPKGAKKWDRALLTCIRLSQLARYILAGIDQRYHWTDGFPLAIEVIALVFCLAGYALFEWATASNAFFSHIVRIQTDREHAVVSSGPYRFIRHPGYLGAIITEIGLAVLLGSWWGLAASGLCVVFFITRTSLEDRTLRIELPGYGEYARQVKFRLIPGIW